MDEIQTMTNPLLKELASLLSKHQLIHGDGLLSRYEHIWTMDKPLSALAMVLPKTTEELSAIMKLCHQHKQSVAIHGGLTGLVGATKTDRKELVISLEKMNNIEEIDPISKTITVQAGVVLETIHAELAAHDLMFTLNFGAKGSAQVGGFISTNAGGLRVFRYGMTRDLVLGLEVVLANGTIISSMKKIIKDNSGYDLKQLFIGSEGTLGIITKAILKLVEAPKHRHSAWLAVNSYDNVLALLKYLSSCMDGGLSGYELVWGETFEALTSPPSNVKSPLAYGFPYYVLIEQMSSGLASQNIEQFEDILATALERELIEDGAIAYTAADLEWFWQIREDVQVLISQCDNMQQYDVSIPIPEIGKYVKQTREELLSLPEIDKVFALGHVADGNIHFSLGKSQDSEELKHDINQIIYKPLKALGGSVSAEHGIGFDKKRYLPISRSPEEIEVMKGLKKSLDPFGLLNRGRIFDY